MPARSVSTVRKRSFFLVCKVYQLFLYKFQSRQKIWPARFFQLFNEFPAFPNFCFSGNSQLSQNLEILGNFRLRQAQLFPAANNCQNLEDPKNFSAARSSSCQIPSSNRSCKQLSKFGREVKFWYGGRSSCQKTPPPAKETKLGRKEEFK